MHVKFPPYIEATFFQKYLRRFLDQNADLYKCVVLIFKEKMRIEGPNTVGWKTLLEIKKWNGASNLNSEDYKDGAQHLLK